MMQYDEDMEILKETVQSLYRLSFGFWILMMQCGFAFIEAGSVRSKNVTTILFKNLMDMVLGTLVFWGFGLAFILGVPGNAFIGHNNFFGTCLAEGNSSFVEDGGVGLELTESTYYPMFVYHLAFAVTSSTIVSGALAERTQFGGYAVYSFVIIGLIYPTVAHWTWSDMGWLQTGAGTGLRFKDFAGSGTVHLVGGAVSLVGVYIIGPRQGRFFKNPEHDSLDGHSTPFISLGGFILIVAFLAFNAGSIPNVLEKGAGRKMARIVANTILSGSCGSLTSMLIKLAINKRRSDRVQWSLLNTINGCLAGMVAACAAPDCIEPWAACLTGILAGIFYISWDILIPKIGLDDALSAIPVHFGGGLVGCLTAPLFAFEGLHINDPTVRGVFYDWSTKSLLGFGWNLLGTVCIITWSMVLGGILFVILKKINLLRITEEEERSGLDVVQHELAYPEVLTASGQLNKQVESIENIITVQQAVQSSNSEATL